jgi:hypothetical protein
MRILILLALCMSGLCFAKPVFYLSAKDGQVWLRRNRNFLLMVEAYVGDDLAIVREISYGSSWYLKKGFFKISLQTILDHQQDFSLHELGGFYVDTWRVPRATLHRAIDPALTPFSIGELVWTAEGIGVTRLVFDDGRLLVLPASPIQGAAKSVSRRLGIKEITTDMIVAASQTKKVEAATNLTIQRTADFAGGWHCLRFLK